MKQHRRRELCVALALFMCIGCKQSSPIVGKWDGKMQSMTFQLTFKPDGTYEMLNSVTAAQSITMAGDYKLEKDKLSMTFRKASFKGLADDLRKMVEEGMKKDEGKTTSGTVKFEGSDSMTIEGFGDKSNGPVSFKRAK